MKSLFFKYLVLAILLLGIIEVSSFLFVKFYISSKIKFYDYPQFQEVFSKKDFESFMRIRHPVLGWPKPSDFGLYKVGSSAKGRHFDITGARFSPAFPEPVNACVSLYGDSFTWGDEVSDKEAWGNVMSKKLNCRVANYGMGGFGTDQAYLRFSNSDDKTDIIILSHMSVDIMRNVNQWRAFIREEPIKHNLPIFKPRFVIGSAGELELIPLPTFSYSEFRMAIAHPTEYLKYDFLVPGALGGLTTPSFPYLFTVYRAYRGHFLKTAWRYYYNKSHPSDSYRVTKKILEAFDLEVRNRGKIPLIFFIPHPSEIVYFKKNGKWISDGMAQEIASNGATVVNIGIRMIEIVGKDKICDYFTRGKCGAHFNPRGNELLANIAYQEIQKIKSLYKSKEVSH